MKQKIALQKLSSSIPGQNNFFSEKNVHLSWIRTQDFLICKFCKKLIQVRIFFVSVFFQKISSVRKQRAYPAASFLT